MGQDVQLIYIYDVTNGIFLGNATWNFGLRNNNAFIINSSGDLVRQAPATASIISSGFSIAFTGVENPKSSGIVAKILCHRIGGIKI